MRSVQHRAHRPENHWGARLSGVLLQHFLFMITVVQKQAGSNFFKIYLQIYSAFFKNDRKETNRILRIKLAFLWLQTPYDHTKRLLSAAYLFFLIGRLLHTKY